MTDSLYFLLVIGLVATVLICFGALVFFLARELRAGSASTAHSQSDLTNMMILFQTMRDILTQQKDLAREFNISIDRKVNEVRHLIQSSGDVRKELDRTRRELAMLATRTRKDIAAIERRLQGVDGIEAPNVEHDEEVADEDVEELEPLESFEPPLEIIPPAPQKPAADLIDRWDTPELEIPDEPDGIEIEEEYEEYSNGNGHNGISEEEERETRSAYRDLLNLQASGSPTMRGPSSSEVLGSHRGGNGGQYLTPIQKRVYEYSDAGMRVPEIARELGVGKGEVRLILSLRQDREH